MQRKTPEQLKILEDHYLVTPLPHPNVVIFMAYKTGLEPRQIKAWFENKRGKEDAIYVEAGYKEVSKEEAARIWRAYKKDPVGYTKWVVEHGSSSEEKD